MTKGCLNKYINHILNLNNNKILLTNKDQNKKLTNCNMKKNIQKAHWRMLKKLRIFFHMIENIKLSKKKLGKYDSLRINLKLKL